MIKHQSIVVEALRVKGPHTVFGLHLLVASAVQAALLCQEATDGLRIVEAQTTMKRLSLLHVRHIEGRMPTHLKPDGLVVGILHMPHHMQLIVLQPIAHSKIE